MKWKLKTISETFLNSFKGLEIILEFIDIVSVNVHAGFLAIVIWINTNKNSERIKEISFENVKCKIWEQSEES